jgi:hypothetical protein
MPELDWIGRIALSLAPQGSSRDDQGDPRTSSILSTRTRTTLALSPHGYRRADTIANPKLASMKSLNYSVGRPRGNGSRDLSKTERADLMAKSASGYEVSVQ